MTAAGACGRIRVEIDPEGAFVVDDDGRGIRVDPVDGVPFAQHALTRFHDAPTLDGHAPHEHLGGTGVGLFPVCALAERLELEVFRDGRHHRQAYVRGMPVTELADAGPAHRRGTRIRVLPDPVIFGCGAVDSAAITTRLHELACLFPRLRFEFADRREQVFAMAEGLAGMLRDSILASGDAMPETIFRCDARMDGIGVEVVAAWTDSSGRRIESFANVHRTTDGGTHVAGLLRGLVLGARQCASLATEGRRSRAIGSARSPGLRAVVHVRLLDPSYARPTRSRLSTPAVTTAVSRCVAPAFSDWLAAQDALRARVASTLG